MRATLARSSPALVALGAAALGVPACVPSGGSAVVQGEHQGRPVDSGGQDRGDTDGGTSDGGSADGGSTDGADTAPPSPPGLRINELMASNTGSWLDPLGHPSDWVELLNPTSAPVDLTGWSLTDDWREPGRGPLPAGLVLEPGGRAVLWLDGVGEAPGHLPMRLSGSGEVVFLFDPSGQEVDELGFGAQRNDEAWARIPDGDGPGVAMPLGTPGAENRVLERTLVEVVAAGSTWAYLDGLQVAPAGWELPGFDDAAWARGPAPLGYGDAQVTIIDDGLTDEGRALVAWFRLGFELTEGPPRAATLRLRADDGARVFLDGVEIARLRLPEGELSADTAASGTAVGVDEETYVEFPFDPALLGPGAHTLAADVRQANRSSSDLTFDLALDLELIR